MASAKLVVTKSRGGSKITLVGTSGTELLSSKVFTEPRGKGATIRSLKGLLGEDIAVEDHTVASGPKSIQAATTRRSPVITRAAKGPLTTTTRRKIRP
jgi:hypothetical protein